MADKNDLLEELQQLTKPIDIPSYRKTSVKWLLKKLPKTNYTNHKNYNRIISICNELDKMGVSGN